MPNANRVRVQLQRGSHIIDKDSTSDISAKKTLSMLKKIHEVGLDEYKKDQEWVNALAKHFKKAEEAVKSAQSSGYMYEGKEYFWSSKDFRCGKINNFHIDITIFGPGKKGVGVRIFT